MPFRQPTVGKCTAVQAKWLLVLCWLHLELKLKALADAVDTGATVPLWEGLVPCLLGSQLLGTVQLC